MIATGLVMLGIGAFVARPYCRFLCPYGVLLSWCSRLSWRHLTITPDECVHCRLCETACPFDAIREPMPPPADRHRARRALAWALITVPVWIAVAAMSGRWLGMALAPRLHPDVALVAELRAEEAVGRADLTWEARVFRASGQSRERADEAAVVAARRLATSWAWAGGMVGLVAAVRIVAAARRPAERDHVADRGDCLSCGRCFAHCPREYVRLGRLAGPMGNPWPCLRRAVPCPPLSPPHSTGWRLVRVLSVRSPAACWR